MPYHLTIPARINILGNPSDGNEGDFATISAAVDVYAGATIEPAAGLILEHLQPASGALECSCRLEFDPSDLPLPYTRELDLVKAAINRLHAFSPEFRKGLQRHGVRIATWTSVPRQSGLGGSSLPVLLTLAGLRLAYGLDPKVHNDYVLAELTQRVEAKELGITCGFADRYVPLFGGIAYLDYRGKLLHEAVRNEPYVSYERLDPWVSELPLVAISTGIERDSGDVHGRMRPRYLEECRGWTTPRDEPPPMVRFMQGAWQTAWRGKIALLEGDLAAFGALMNENHRWVDQMMAYCGFEEGAGWANNLLIDVALANGAYGAKLTGAGAGGSVFALVQPGDEARMMELWRQAALEMGLEQAQVYRLAIVHRGLVVEEV